jgi:uncharacterized membrane protein
VALEAGGQHHARVELRLSGRTLSVGGALSPKERTAFAEALERAIAAARRDRHPSP